MRQPTFSPTDCPNFLRYSNLGTYRWYARVLLPLLVVTRGGPLFAGQRRATLQGEFDFDSWMVVRYPSHRAMLRMAINPYYQAVCNPLRERGTAALELAFTQPQDPDSGLEHQQMVLALHAAPAESAPFFREAQTLAADAGLQVVYESEQRYDFDFIRQPRPADPNPLTYPVTAAVAGGNEADLHTFANRTDVIALLAAQNTAAAVLYERADRLYYLRFGT